MIISLETIKPFEAQKMMADLNSVIRVTKPMNYFIKNNEVGVYDVERMGQALNEKEKLEFWVEVKNTISPYYDVLIDIKKNTLSIYNKGAAPTDREVKLNKLIENTFKEVVGDNNDNSGYKAVKQETKKAAKPRVSKKSKSVQTDKQ